MPIPDTCPDFVEHPHIIPNGEHGEYGFFCYQCQTSCASEEQGTSQIAEALVALGVPCDVHQTGGFTMCVYIKTGEDSYIYANRYGFGFFKNEEDDEGENFDFSNYENNTAEEKAQQIKKAIEKKNLLAIA